MAGPWHLRLRLKRAAALIACCATLSSACARAPDPLILATTTSMGNSGLLDRILPAFHHPPVRPVLVGSGRALQMLAAGTADVVISHAPFAEAESLRAHPEWWYRKILFNDFLIVGPRDDPAGVRGSVDAAEAMRRIARSRSIFLSRGDESGTHERERELWSQAGTAPDEAHHVIAGAGMGQTLRIADATAAYTLTDRGTFEANAAPLNLVVLYAGDARLLNTYAVIADPGNARGAEFARWIGEGAGRELIREVLRRGELRGFSLWPDEVEGRTPAAILRR